MSLSKNILLNSEIRLSEMEILYPKEGDIFIQTNDICSVIVLATDYIPSTKCMFCIQTGLKGLFLINNSVVNYLGCPYLKPNKMYNFNLNYRNGVWYLYCDKEYSGDENVIISWIDFFISKVSGAPPLAARRCAIFINGLYNCLLDHDNLFDQAVINEAGKSLASQLIPTHSAPFYDVFPKLEEKEKGEIEIYTTAYIQAKPIPNAATNPAYTLPAEEKTKWKGVNPILPNWNPVNIGYFLNTYTVAAEEPFSVMEEDAKSLLNLEKNNVRTEIAKYFANTPPPQHLIRISCKLLAEKEFSNVELLKILSLLSIGIADAGIYAWNVKYTYWGARPFHYLSNYVPAISTPNFPGYISGHSTFSAVWNQLLHMMVPSLTNVSKYVADLSGISRLYGGIHFSKDNIVGLEAGRNIGKNIYNQAIAKIKSTEKFI